jgi:hypothetical protein
LNGPSTKPEWLDLAVEEYKALRTEITETSKAQQWAIGLTLTALGVIVSQASNLWKDPLLATAVFLIFVPMLVTMMLLVWLAQIGSIIRTGAYLSGVETAVRDAWPGVPDGVFGWERYLRGSERPWWTHLYEWGHVGVVGLLTLVGAGSIALGWYKASVTADGPALISGTVRGFESEDVLALAISGLLGVIVLFAFVSSVILARRR